MINPVMSMIQWSTSNQWKWGDIDNEAGLYSTQAFDTSDLKYLKQFAVFNGFARKTDDNADTCQKK